jgi:AcrR family transcriptional regulator
MAGPRLYLRPNARKQQLLDAAARIFEEHGYAGMTMVAVAEEAGVSRRLVYDHFPDVAGLYEAFFADRAARYLDLIDVVFAEAGDDVPAAFAGVFGQLVAMPPVDLRVVRLLLVDSGLPELARLRTQFRRYVEDRWLPILPKARVDRKRVKALLWTYVNALFALAELVSSREISARDATALASALVAAGPGVIANAQPTLALVRE